MNKKTIKKIIKVINDNRFDDDISSATILGMIRFILNDAKAQNLEEGK